MDVMLNVALPVFGIVLAGYLSGRFQLLGRNSSEALNSFVYYFALPPYLFIATARAPVAQMVNLPFLAAFVGGFGITFAVGAIIGRLLRRERLAVHALQGLASAFANTGYMGIPLFIAAFGTEGTLPAVIASVFNAAGAIALGIALIEIDLSPGARWSTVARDVLTALLRNPLVTMPVLGTLASLAGLSVPTPVGNFCALLGAAAGPCALFALGLSLVGQSLATTLGEVAWVGALKLVGQPLVTWVIAVLLLRMEPRWASAAVLLAALPTGSLLFTVAQKYRIYVDRASAITLATTAASVVTLSLLLLGSG